METVVFPYGNETRILRVPKNRLKGVLRSSLHHYSPDKTQDQLVEEALAAPISSPPLHQLAKGKQKVVLIASDHTRPVPSKVIVPPMLREIRRGNPAAEITILIATGCHREMTRAELIGKFGADIVERERIEVHNCDTSPLISIGYMPSGGECIINRTAYDADLLVAEGFIEPHFFAGFSGGRKSVMPGIAGRLTVLANHCAEFIAHPNARTGIIEDNPIHYDMLWAAKKAGLAFIVNVVINERKEAVHAVAGDAEIAHLAGCEFLNSLCRTEAMPADIVVSSNGGYPLDQNIYQAVKGMTAAEATVKKDGVIIMLAKSEDGHGGENFYRQMSEEADIGKTLAAMLKRDRNETEPDQWQAQIFIRVLQKATVIYVSDAPDEMVRNLHMIPATDPEDALAKAEMIVGSSNADITAIPDGVAVIVA